MNGVVRGSLGVVVLLCALAASAAGRPLQAAAYTRASERATPVSFRAADGVRLKGIVLGSGSTGIVFAHQVGGERHQWLPFARELANKGYRALVFDMRGYGASSGVANTSPDLDVIAAAGELRRRGAKRIVLVGASMGGTGVVAAAPRIRPAITGLVELSAPTAFGGADALAAVKRLEAPALFIAGRDDGDFAAATRALYKAAASRNKQLRLVPSSWHGVDLLAIPSVKKLVLGFLQRMR